MKVNSIRSGIRYASGGVKTPYVEVRRFPTLRSYLWAKSYHWYDLRIPTRLPGWKRFERFLGRRGAEHRHGFEGEPNPRWRDRLYGWTVEQDLRCYYLNDLIPEHIAYVDDEPL